MKISERKELAKLLTLLDDGRPEGLEKLAARKIHGLPYIVVITGAAGVGKSLLLSKLLTGGKQGRVGVLAVDPTSAVSGGALLGDRVRMPGLPPNVFLRSVATRGATGGISEKLIDMAAAMMAYGFDSVYVETVGIGQDETEVRHVADTLVVVEAPGLGDEIQAMKASPLSLADIVVVNKSDKPGAAETAAVIAETVNKKPVLTSAQEGIGILDLRAELARAKNRAMQTKIKKHADRKKLAWRLTRAMARKWADRVSREAGNIISEALERGENVYKQLQTIHSFLPDHVAIAVPDLDKAVAVYRKLGFFLERRERVPKEHVETAFFNAGGFHIELLQATSAESPISKFVAERGGGIHHIAFEVDDLSDAMREVQSEGFETLGGMRPGTRGKQILFLHPKSTCRALLELCSCKMQSEPHDRED